MSLNRMPFRDPRTVARDIPGVLDILFPRLSGSLVAALNRDAFSYPDLIPVPIGLAEQSQLQKAMLFEVAVARAELIISGQEEPEWAECLAVALERQSRHYDARRPEGIKEVDQKVAEHAARNLVSMLRRTSKTYGAPIERNPTIPGMGWITSGNGDFSVGSILIEVKHTNRNFIAGDFRQVLMYWLLKYADAIESDDEVWGDCLLLNPRRNSGLAVNFDKLLQSASSNSNRVELFEALRSVLEHDIVRR